MEKVIKRKSEILFYDQGPGREEKRQLTPTKESAPKSHLTRERSTNISFEKSLVFKTYK